MKYNTQKIADDTVSFFLTNIKIFTVAFSMLAGTTLSTNVMAQQFCTDTVPGQELTLNTGNCFHAGIGNNVIKLIDVPGSPHRVATFTINGRSIGLEPGQERTFGNEVRFSVIHIRNKTNGKENGTATVRISNAQHFSVNHSQKNYVTPGYTAPAYVPPVYVPPVIVAPACNPLHINSFGVHTHYKTNKYGQILFDMYGRPMLRYGH